MLLVSAAVMGVLLAIVGLARFALVFPRIAAAPHDPDAATTRDRAGRLMADVVAVASRPHNIAHYAALQDAAAHIEAVLSACGLEPVSQRFTVEGLEVRNIEVVFEPSHADGAQTYVIGAHYDAPDDCPGANDNGTGVAALLELARALSGEQPQTARLRLVFFVNEEQPYGKTPQMGSWQYAKALKERGERVAGMIALETLGHFSETPGSQRFPAPFGLIYPDRGNFVAFIALPGARAFLHRAIAPFRRSCSIPSIGGVIPGFVPGADLSDHWAFHQFGFPALMLTDTAPFRNPYYHELNDTPETVDYRSLARICHGIEVFARDLAGFRPAGERAASAVPVRIER